MKYLIIVLQRSELNYLIKYDAQKVSSDRIINFSHSEFKSLSEGHKISLLEQSLPIYEQDHEVLLIEYNPTLISYRNGVSLEFRGILSIIPLTETGARLLSSKLDTNFKIKEPLNNKVYKLFVNNRNHNLRFKAGEKFCSVYQVPVPNEDFIEDFRKATLFQLNELTPKPSDSTLAHLIDFNITPSFIPEGNIEALIKSACVGMKKLDKEVNQIPRSKFYSFVIEHKESINNKSLFQGIQYVEDKIEFSDDAKNGFNQLKTTLTEKSKYDKAFLYFSYFYFLKKEIEKNDYDISIKKDDILELKHYDVDAASKVLYMLGYTFSIQTISKSIQLFSDSELLKSPEELDLNWTPPIVEKEDNNNLIENQIEAPPESITSNTEKNQHSKDYIIEDEKPFEVELSIENKIDETTTDQYESSMNETQPSSQKVNLFTSQEKSAEKSGVAETSKSIFSFTQFKKNVGKGKFADKIDEVLKNKNLPENEITEQIMISCLEEVNEYKTRKGDIRDTAKRALKIFETA